LNQDVFVFGQDSRFDDEHIDYTCDDDDGSAVVGSSVLDHLCITVECIEPINAPEDSQVNKYIPGVTCLDNETGITPYIQASGNPIKLGRIPASTIPMTGLTQYASIKIVDILIDLEYG
jgi:hypothetical protein